MIYLFDDISSFTAQDLALGLASVSGQRREHALRFRFNKDRKLSVIAYLLLMYGLEREYGITEPQEFCISEKGKPSFINHPDIFFNISHCNKAVVCAINDNPVGIDVEEFSHYSVELSQQVHNTAENEAIAAFLHPEEEFCRLWTVKEAILKITGIGLVDDTRPLLTQYPDIVLHSQIYSSKGYAMSYALYSPQEIPILQVNALF